MKPIPNCFQRNALTTNAKCKTERVEVCLLRNARKTKFEPVKYDKYRTHATNITHARVKYPNLETATNNKHWAQGN